MNITIIGHSPPAWDDRMRAPGAPEPAGAESAGLHCGMGAAPAVWSRRAPRPWVPIRRVDDAWPRSGRAVRPTTPEGAEPTDTSDRKGKGTRHASRPAPANDVHVPNPTRDRPRGGVLQRHRRR